MDVGSLLLSSFHEFSDSRIVNKVKKVMIRSEVIVRYVWIIRYMRPGADRGGVDDQMTVG